MSAAAEARLVVIDGDPPPEGAQTRLLKRDGREVRYLTTPPKGAAKGSVLIAPGRAEFIEKYFEAARELQARGYAVMITDHYGQGLSGRPLKDPFKGHIDDVETYAGDFEAMTEEAGDALPGPRIILAHSMGGLIAARVLQRQRLAIAACAMSAPMLGFSGAAPGARLIASAAVLFGFAARTVPGRDQNAEPHYEGNMLTHDHRRFDRMVRYYEAERRLLLGAPTIGWVAASARAFRRVRAPEAMAAVTMPVLVASAGREALVSNRAQERWAARGASAQLVSLPKARHEILMETDAIRAEFWSAFDALLARAGL